MPIFYGSSQVMDSSLHEDDSLQSGWPLGINLVSMDHDGDLAANDSTLVVLHDPLITDASDHVPKTELLGVARLATNPTHEKPKETKSIIVTTVATEEPVAPVTKVHYVNGKHQTALILPVRRLLMRLMKESPASLSTPRFHRQKQAGALRDIIPEVIEMCTALLDADVTFGQVVVHLLKQVTPVQD